jgi:hypothetical protein
MPKIIGQHEDVFQTWVDGGGTSGINTAPSEVLLHSQLYSIYINRKAY